MQEKNSKLECKTSKGTRDVRFVPEIQHHNGAYVSVEESMKEWVSLNPRTSTSDHQGSLDSPLKILSRGG
jgi:hypothetical protein